MVKMRPERFPQGSNRKLQDCSTGPFKILSKIGENAYILEIPSDWGISFTLMLRIYPVSRFNLYAFKSF